MEAVKHFGKIFVVGGFLLKDFVAAVLEVREYVVRKLSQLLAVNDPKVTQARTIFLL